MKKLMLGLIVIVALVVGTLIGSLIPEEMKDMFYPDYEFKDDRNIDNNCLEYSRQLRDELLSEGKNATLVGFWTKGQLGHCMVIVDAKTINYTVIESYTGQEFKMGDDIDSYLFDILGYYPEEMWIK